MSNLDITYQDQDSNNSPGDFLYKNKICLFNFSNLKSHTKLTLSQFNTFNYDLSGKDLTDTKNNQMNSQIKSDNTRYIKNINIEIPSSEKLSKEEYKNAFISQYNESFPNFCGLSEEQFTEIYINNKYIPKIDELGDINLSIKCILRILEDFSDSKRIKIRRRAHKRNRIKKYLKMHNSNLAQNKSKNIFHIIQTDKVKKRNESKKENSTNNLDNKNDNDNKDELKNNIQDTPSLISQNNNNQNSQKINEKTTGKTLQNIKKKLKNISIPSNSNRALSINDNSSNISNSLLDQKNILNEHNIDSNINNTNSNNFIIKDNNINLNNDSNKRITLENKNLDFSSNQNNLSNQFFQHNLHSADNNNNNNIFNFSSNIIQNLPSNAQNKSVNDIPIKHTFSPFFNNNALNQSLNNNLNNTPINRPVLSPIYYSPGIGNILSPNYCNNNISSPFEVNVSPFNNNLFNDHFVFNNENASSFFFDNNNENSNDNKNEDKNNNNENNNNNKANNDDNNENKNNTGNNDECNYDKKGNEDINKEN